MAESKKEPVRIALPQELETLRLENDGARHGFARIAPPLRTAMASHPPPTLVPRLAADADQVSHLATIDAAPLWICWGLFGLSALIFLIEIWNYALS